MKRVLIITYYWPPSGGSGVQRWLKMSKYLPENGWQPVIYTAKDAEYPVEDLTLEKDVCPETEVIRRKIVEPYSFYKKFLGKKKSERIKASFIDEKKNETWKQKLSVWIRGNFFIPDARCWWIRPSVRFLKKYLKRNPVDAIISTGPPHSMHLIALKLHEKTNIPWIADFRDPWTEIDFYHELMLTSCADKKHHALEKEVLTKANTVATVGRQCALGLERNGNRPVHVITNGFDENEWGNSNIGNQIKLTEKFTISHIGIIGKDRNPEKFWKAIHDLVQQHPDFEKKLEVRLIGQVDQSVMDSIKNEGIELYVKVIPYLPHDKVIKMQVESQILLLLINHTPNAKSILTGKLFEYLKSGRPILCIGPEDGDSAVILEECEAGKTIDFDDKSKMESVLIDLMDRYKKEGLAAHQNESIEKYSRRNLAKRFVELLNA